MAFAASTIIGAIGLGVAGFGAIENYTNSEKAAKANSAAAADQAQIEQLQANNVDVEQQQLKLQTQQTLLQSQTQRSVIQDQAQADAIRQQAATLDATRRQREAVRAGIVARAQGLATATNQGANEVGSTAFRQASASITGQTNTNVTGIQQQLTLGNKLYDINKDITAQYLNASYANDEFVQQSESLQSNVLNTQKQIYALGGNANSDYATAALANGNAALGAGLMNLGGSVISNYNTINKFASSLPSIGNLTSNLTNGFTSFLG